MYLKSLEMQGFKSFANKTKFDFKDGITAIVGPNGSGKSNVSDAIKWVLGEQSAKKLRGGKMEDIIFSGTQEKKEHSFAYVSITFDNKDRKLNFDSELVKITRKVYKSGDSEYKINDATCRLRDIEELFYDTGIGKEGYSLIGQGRIDKLLSGKSEEKRELFDEAAGIVKYKKRKQEANKKLRLQNENLLRVNDILNELEQRIEPLKKQEEKAKKFLEYKEELKILDCRNFILKTKTLEEDKNLLLDDIKKLEEEHSKLSTEYEKTKEKYSLTLKNLEDLEESKKENETKIVYLSEKSNEIKTKIKVLEENINFSNQKIEENEKALEEIILYIPKCEEEKEEIKKEKEEIEKKLEKLKKELEEKEKALKNLSEESKKIEDLNESNNNKLIDVIKSQERLSSNIESISNTIKNLTEESRLLKEKYEKILIYENEIESSIKEISDEFNNANEKVKSLVEDKENLSKNIKEYGEEEVLKSGTLYNLKTNLVKEKARLDSLKSVKESYDGYAQSVKNIMEAYGKNDDVIGVVADLINTKKEYEKAVEISLGASCQNIVTKNEKVAKDLIAYLKEKKAGRATFLPIDSIKVKSQLDLSKIKGASGIIGLASDIVSIKECYKHLATFLLGKTLIVDTLDNALLIAKENNYSIKIVTLQGEQLNPGGSLTGGSFKYASNLLSRQRIIDEAKKEILKLEEDILQKEKDLEKIISKKNAFILELENINQRLNDESVERNSLGIKLQVEKDKEKQHKIELEKVKNRLEEIKETLKNEEESRTLLGVRLEEERKKEEKITVLNSNQKDESFKKRQEEEDLKEEINNIKIRISTHEKERQHKLVLFNNAEDEIIKEKSEEEKLLSVKKDLLNKKSEKEESLHILKNEEHICNKEYENTKSDLEKIENQIKKIHITHKDFIENKEKDFEKINDLDKEIFKEKTKLEKIEEKLLDITDYMWNEYELTYSYAKEVASKIKENDDNLDILISKIKSKIKSLGNVNVDAIKEFEEENKRYVFLKEQHADLTESRAELEKIIKELDHDMKKQFLEKFALINEEFEKSFKSLFGGGKCGVSIEEDRDILEADIIVNAQPPGKKLQNMLQLSGGEKALAAIALLFAIQKLKPSSFCLLDEIEAALDDANVGRFASFLSNLSDNTQYIVITHRRGTMVAANRLYGVTMQEKGISTLVSVELEKRG